MPPSTLFSFRHVLCLPTICNAWRTRIYIKTEASSWTLCIEDIEENGTYPFYNSLQCLERFNTAPYSLLLPLILALGLHFERGPSCYVFFSHDGIAACIIFLMHCCWWDLWMMNGHLRPSFFLSFRWLFGGRLGVVWVRKGAGGDGVDSLHTPFLLRSSNILAVLM